MRSKFVVSVSCAVTVAGALAGCGSYGGGEGFVAAENADTVAESSYVSDSVLHALEAWPALRGVTWNVTHDNRFGADWLLQTPMQPLFGQSVSSLQVPAPCTTNCNADFGLARCGSQSDCQGGGTCTPVLATVRSASATPESLCVGHSDALYDRVYRVMTSATRFVDVTSLQPPDGRFEAAIRNAITLLASRPNPPEVRLLFGAFPVQGVVNTKTVLKSLTRDVPSTSSIRVAVGAFRSSDLPSSWNHSKIVAADGQTAIVGGHNLWTQHYLAMDPVSDLSMQVNGSAAADAHRFANRLWKYTCDNMTWATWLTWSVWINQLENGSITSHCPAQYNLPAVAGPAAGTVIAVGRLGSGIQADGNQADAARLALMRSARSTIRMALQDVGPVKAPVLGIPLASWPNDEIAEIGNALQRGVDVYVVLSNLDAVAGGLSATYASYSNGWTLEEVGAHVRAYMESQPGFASGAALTALLCSKLHLAPLRYSSDAAWPDGVPFANHTKTIAIDEQAFYIGSQNVYPAGLQEFGYIVDDARATRDYLARFWANMWTYSSRAAVSGTEAVSCTL